ncbi:MAG: sugar ABC transporter permease [Limnochordaceae bacterium]|nr:sugar ABC transporter permease [Limnochordaceae bacterium]
MDRRSEHFVGLSNYVRLFTSSAMLTAFRNNLLWLVVFTAGTVGLGLLMAVLTDRVRYEAAAKALIFLPMAISFVGAGVIWKFMYAYQPPGVPQIGLANQVMVMLGQQPRGWLVERPWVNNLALIAVGVWIWTGFAMVVLSAAYKAIPKELLEAARVDGATEWQVFWRISLPVIQSTVAVVATTMIINVLKVFDIVYVMTNGNFGTEVMANRMYKEMFEYQDFGRASAIAVILFLAIVPIMLANIRRFRRQEATR